MTSTNPSDAVPSVAAIDGDPAQTALDSAEACALDDKRQLRNVVIYVLSNWLIYLAAPVLYVGITQAALCNALGASATLANLPNSAFFWMTSVPIVFAMWFPSIHAVKRVLAACNVACALGGLFVVLGLVFPLPGGVRVASVIAYGALIGGALATFNVFSWELVKHGISASRRGIAYSLAYGIGPLFAVMGSLATQLALAGEVALPFPSASSLLAMHTVRVSTLAFPLNFVLVFGASVPIMLAGAVLAGYYILPSVETRSATQPFFASVRDGLAGILQDRILLVAIVAFLAVSGGGTIVNNMSLYTVEAVGRASEELAGSQNAIRFGFKSVVGLLLGWLLIRTNAKVGMLATSGLGVAGILWILCMPRQWFLISFGFMGAVDLSGVYYPNYILNRSRPERVRLNMALLSLLTIGSSVAPAMFGAISDQFGFYASFVVAACIVGGSFTLVLLCLPAKVEPPEDACPPDMTGSIVCDRPTPAAEFP